MASIAELNKTKAELRGKIQDYIRMRLGDGMVDVELDTEHYNMAIDKAVMRYRQRSQNSQEESYAFQTKYYK
jgi:translation initiation factor IF-1